MDRFCPKSTQTIKNQINRTLKKTIMKIMINIDGRDYEGSQETPIGCSKDKALLDAINKDWQHLTWLLLSVAELWMVAKERESCQICYNHGSGSIAVGKHGSHPYTPDPYEAEEEETQHWELPNECYR